MTTAFPALLTALTLTLSLAGCSPREIAPPSEAPTAPSAADSAVVSDLIDAPVSGIIQAPVPDIAETPAPEPEPEPEPTPEPEPEPATVLVAKDTGSPVEMVLPARGPVVEGKMLSGKLICVDPGHGNTPLLGKGYKVPVSPLSGEMKPAYATGTHGKRLTEEQVNLQVGLLLQARLEELGATVLMTRTENNATINNVERCEIANAAGADVHIHLHCDGAGSSSAHGVSVLIPTGDLLCEPSIKEESARLGKLMVDAVAARTGAKNLGTTGRSDLTGLNYSQVPSVFIEMGFMTNPTEDANLCDPAYQAEIVEGIAEAVLTWFGNDLSNG